MLQFMGSQRVGHNCKESTCSAGDLGLTPGLGRSPGEGKGYPLQYSGLEKCMDCRVHGITPSFGSTEGNIKGRKKINKQLKIADCEPYGNSPSGEAAQTPAHGTPGEPGLISRGSK